MRDDITQAAAELRQFAAELRASHTIGPDWTDIDAEEDYDRLRALASRLEAIRQDGEQGEPAALNRQALFDLIAGTDAAASDYSGDNVAVALCSYFEDHGARPNDDEPVSDEHCWGAWVEEQYAATVYAIADRILAAHPAPAVTAEQAPTSMTTIKPTDPVEVTRAQANAYFAAMKVLSLELHEYLPDAIRRVQANYDAAVKGRSDFRDALRKERATPPAAVAVPEVQP